MGSTQCWPLGVSVGVTKTRPEQRDPEKHKRVHDLEPQLENDLFQQY